MRIVQCVGFYFPESSGGSEVYVEGLSKRLMAAGHEVTVAVPSPGSPGPRSYEHNGVSVFRYPTPANPSRAECQGAQPVRGTEHLLKWLSKIKPDVLHLHTFVTGIGIREARAAKQIGVRVIATSHSSNLGYVCQRGTMMQWGEQLCNGICSVRKCASCELQNHGLTKALALTIGGIPPSASGLLSRIPGKIGTALGMSNMIQSNIATQDEMLRTVDKFVLLTKWALDAVIANGAPRDRVELNRLGFSQRVTARKSAARPTARPIRLAYVGRLDPIKGVCILASAFKAISAHEDIKLEFRGAMPPRGGCKTTYKRVLDILGGDPRVTFAEPVAPASVPQVLAGYDVLVCPSLCLEGGPTVAIEAHAVGTPVIGSRIGGLAELIDDQVNGMLLPPGDVEALSQAIAKIAADPTGTIDHWRNHLPDARNMDDVAADYLKLYED